MHTFVSGLSEQAFFSIVGEPLDNPSLEWVPANEFITNALARCGEETGTQWFWLYRAPWTIRAEGDAQQSMHAIEQWQEHQRAILRLREPFRQNVLFVNIDRVSLGLLAERLGLVKRSPPSRFDPGSSLLPALASLFKQVAPGCWELYEELEACAWHPQGKPECRSDYLSPRANELASLLDIVNMYEQLAAAHHRLQERESELCQMNKNLRSTLEASEAARRQVEEDSLEHQRALQVANSHAQALLADKNALVEENELLVTQLHHVQEEVEQYHFDNLSLKEKQATLENELVQSAAAHQQASNELAITTDRKAKIEQRCQELVLEQARLLHEKSELQAGVQMQADENRLLLEQLHYVQEELETYYLANREIISVMEKSSRTLHRARQIVSHMAAR